MIVAKDPRDLKSVTAAMFLKLKESALTTAHAKLLNLQPTTEQQARSLNIHPAWAGFKIPYFALDGRQRDIFRFRYLQDKPTTGFAALTTSPEKPQKYAQPKDSEPAAYLPPMLTWKKIAADAGTAVTITEGELKAACACSIGIPVIGLGGVWSFQSARLGWELLPELESFKWRGRDVVICYDSDLATNGEVARAKYKLTMALVARGAEVRHATIPAEGTAKVGLDDYLVSHGTEAFAKLLHDAVTADYCAAINTMNEKVAYVRSTQEIIEFDSGTVMSARTFAEVAYKPYKHAELTTGPDGKITSKVKYTAKEWLECPHRNEVSKLVYEPGLPAITADNAYNLWHPFAIQPVKGSIAPWERIFNMIMRGADPAHATWLRRWFAAPLRVPGLKVRSGVLIWSMGQRIGKGILGVTMKRLYGPNFHKTSDDILFGRFGYWAHRRCFIMIDEIEPKTKYETSNKLKDIITRDEITIELKGTAPYTTRDCLIYYFTSNELDALQLSQQDSRFFIWETTAAAIGPEERNAYFHWLDHDGGAANLMHYFTQELDMGDFDANEPPPVTVAKREMISSGMAELPFLCNRLAIDRASELPPPLNTRHLFTAKELLKALDPEGKHRWTQNHLSRCLKRAGFKLTANGTNNATAHGAREYMWALCREPKCEALNAAAATAWYTKEWPDPYAAQKFAAKRAQDREQKESVQ